MRFKSDLRAAQNSIATEFYENDACLAIVPMGGGKTAAALTAFAELLADGVVRGGLVVAPKRVVQFVWTREHQHWQHLQHLRISPMIGKADARLKALDEDAHLWLIGIDNLPWLLKYLETLPADHPIFDLIIFDEISRFRNPRSKRARMYLSFIRRFKRAWPIAWGLTGTPRPNGYEDFYRPMQMITREKLWDKSFDRWLRQRFAPVDFNGYTWAIRPEWRDRTKRDVAQYAVTIRSMPELPPLTFVPHWLDMPPKIMEQYKIMERKLLLREGGDTVLAANQAVATGKLAQIVQGFIYDEDGAAIDLHTVKADCTVDLVEGCGGDPVMIAYEFRYDLDVLKALWPAARWLGAGISDKDAELTEAMWNRGELPVLPLHPASAGHGLNLQFGGHQFIWHCLTWSAELFDQTIKRFHRPGQEENCFVHLPMMRDTIDEIKYDRVVNKLSEQEAFRKYVRKL